MPRYIDVDGLYERVKDYPYGVRGMVLNDIAQVPTADMVEVKHGKWIKQPIVKTSLPPQYVWECSECGKWLTGFVTTDYCPNCGANMRGET